MTHTRSIFLVSAAALMACMGACRTAGNDRSMTGDPRSPDAVALNTLTISGQRDEHPRSADAPSLAGLSRAGWQLQTINVPVDGVNAYRRYARMFPQTEETARQRGDFPTPLTTLDMPEAFSDEQITEVLVSGPAAFYEGLALVPRLFFVSPDEEIRTTPQPYWRAPVTTPRTTRAQRSADIPRPADLAADPAAAPTPAK